MPNDEAKGEPITVTSLTELGLEGFPETFERGGVVWTKDNTLDAGDGTPQYTEYTTKDAEGRKWLVVANE